MTNDAVQNHRLDTIERRLDKHDEMLAKLLEAQIRTDEQFTALAETQKGTQEMINGIGKSIIKWMMGLGSILVTAMIGVQGVM
jgi:vacuolar-type H+-ATPase subunit D/Vma8|tara:strand:- start:77 stop:325 length:249 start_codon:yes stop_codon:yes gene_type:complete